ncbi:MAG: hypothetical protein Q4G23_11025 [Clostridia bacterium]|nr:hypothetical protein [Clostridia bacterium]
MKFPTYEEMAKDVAEKALDEYIYQGKTLREWVQIISENQDSDCISRKEVLKLIEESVAKYYGQYSMDMLNMWGLFSQMITELPSVTPKLEPCEDCISREAARDLMYHKQEPLTEYDLDTLPSVIPKPKTGWHIAHGLYEDRFWCSCGYIKIIDSNMSEWKHCPICGAKMSEIPTGSEGSDKE